MKTEGSVHPTPKTVPQNVGFNPTPKTVQKTVGFNPTYIGVGFNPTPKKLKRSNQSINQSIALHPLAHKYEGLQHNAKQQMLVPPLCAAATTTCQKSKPNY